MSRRGDCWDNAPVESFFRTLKAGTPSSATLGPTRASAAAAVPRLHRAVLQHGRGCIRSLGYQSPARLERRAQAVMWRYVSTKTDQDHLNMKSI